MSNNLFIDTSQLCLNGIRAFSLSKLKMKAVLREVYDRKVAGSMLIAHLRLPFFPCKHMCIKCISLSPVYVAFYLKKEICTRVVNRAGHFGRVRAEL